MHFGAARDATTHREVPTRFHCEGADLAGVLTMPRGRGPFPAVVWVHGSGEALRLTYSEAPFVRSLVQAGFAVLSYDKRGVGESEGEGAVPATPATSTCWRLTQPALFMPSFHAPTLIRPRWASSGRVRPAGSCLLPLPGSTARSPSPPWSMRRLSATGRSSASPQLTGEEGGGASRDVDADILTEVRSGGPSGFISPAICGSWTPPGLWLYGGADRSQPTALDVDVLAQLRSDGKNFTSKVFASADHGLLDNPPSDERALPWLVTWMQRVTGMLR